MSRVRGVLAGAFLLSVACSDYSPRPVVTVILPEGNPTTTGPTGPTVIRTAASWPDLLFLVESGKAHEALPSFRTVMTSLAGGRDVADFTQAWLRTYTTPQTLNVDGVTLTAAPRPRGTDALECAWLRQRPSNGCDATCGACNARILDMDVAPFELVAVVNRVDIGTSACAESGAEARLVFGAIDPSNKAPLALTVIFEYGLRGATRDWARRFAVLRSLHKVEDQELFLGNIVQSFALETPRLLRMRTNEALFGASSKDWEFREFNVDSSARAFVPAPLASSPALALNRSSVLGAWIREHHSDIKTGKNPLPAEYQTLALGFPDARFEWSASGDAQQDKAFSGNTCNGCHGGSRPQEPFEFHLLARAPNAVPKPVAPPNNSGSRGLVYTQAVNVPVDAPTPPSTVLVSRFLFDPKQPEKSELAHRDVSSQAILAADCSAPNSFRITPQPLARRVH
jgi:hypothetical protein